MSHSLSTTDSVSIKLNAQGRCVIPASLRVALGINQSSQLFASIENGKIVIERKLPPLERFALRFAAARQKLALEKAKNPETLSPSEALIEERRLEAAREHI